MKWEGKTSLKHSITYKTSIELTQINRRKYKNSLKGYRHSTSQMSDKINVSLRLSLRVSFKSCILAQGVQNWMHSYSATKSM